MDIEKECSPRSDAAESGVWSGSALFASNTEISIISGNAKNKDKHPLDWKGTGPKSEVEKSTRQNALP